MYIVFLTFYHDIIDFCDIIHAFVSFREYPCTKPLPSASIAPNIYGVWGDSTLRTSPQNHDTDNIPYLFVLPYIPYHTKYLSTNDFENKVRSTKVYVSLSFAVIGRFHFKRFFTVSIATLTTSSNP